MKNILLAIAIFWGLNLAQGMEHHRVTTIGYVQDSSLAASYGLRPGDRIVSVNGETMETWEGIREAIVYARHPPQGFCRCEQQGLEGLRAVGPGELALAVVGSGAVVAGCLVVVHATGQLVGGIQGAVLDDPLFAHRSQHAVARRPQAIDQGLEAGAGQKCRRALHVTRQLPSVRPNVRDSSYLYVNIGGL